MLGNLTRLELVAETQANSKKELPLMKRVSVVTLSIAAAALTLLIAQFAPAQSAPSNDTSCAAVQQAAPGSDFVYWFDLYLEKPCAAMQQAAPSNNTSSAAMQQAAPGSDFVYWFDLYLPMGPSHGSSTNQSRGL
jgi:hypothetical protein